MFPLSSVYSLVVNEVGILPRVVSVTTKCST